MPNGNLQKLKELTKKLEDRGREKDYLLSLFVSLISVLPFGIFVMDKDGKILIASNNTKEILGVDLIEVDTERAFMSMPDYYGAYYPDTQIKYKSDEYPTIRSLKGVYIDNERMLFINEGHPNGTIINVTSRPIYQNGEIIGSFAIYNIETEKEYEVV